MIVKVLNSGSGTSSHLCAWRKEEHGILAATSKSGGLFETFLFAFYVCWGKKNQYTKMLFLRETNRRATFWKKSQREEQERQKIQDRRKDRNISFV